MATLIAMGVGVLAIIAGLSVRSDTSFTFIIIGMIKVSGGVIQIMSKVIW